MTAEKSVSVAALDPRAASTLAAARRPVHFGARLGARPLRRRRLGVPGLRPGDAVRAHDAGRHVAAAAGEPHRGPAHRPLAPPLHAGREHHRRVAHALLLAFFLQAGPLRPWQAYLTTAVGALFAAFEIPAVQATVPLFVARENLGRANGFVQLSWGGGQLLAPAIGGLLIAAVHPQVVVAIAGALYLLALGAFALLALPQRAAAAAQGFTAVLQDFLSGLRYLAARPALLDLMVLFAVVNFFLGIVLALSAPLVLSSFTPAVLGMVMTIGGVGMIAGSITLGPLGKWGRAHRARDPRHHRLGSLPRPRRRAAVDPAHRHRLLRRLLLGPGRRRHAGGDLPDQGRAGDARADLLGQPDDRPVDAAAGDAGGGSAGRQSVRAAAARRRLAGGECGTLIGVGKGRGIGLIFILAGLLTTIAGIAGWLRPRVRRLDFDLPDAAPQTPSAPGEGLLPASTPTAAS